MTAAERLRAAVKAALPLGHRSGQLRRAILAAVLPIVEELERDRDRLREKMRRAMHYLEAAGIVAAVRREQDGE